MSGFRILVVGCSVRPGRMNERVLKFVESRLKVRGHEVQIIDPKQWNLSLIENPLHFYPDRSKAPQKVKDLNAVIEKADAYLITTAEYNRCIPPALTNLLDHVSPMFFSMKPAGIVSYSMGGSGGSLAGGQTRQLLSELGCVVVPHFSSLPKVQDQISDDGQTESSYFISEIDFIIDQLEYLVKARKNLEKHDESVKVPKPHPYSS